MGEIAEISARAKNGHVTGKPPLSPADRLAIRRASLEVASSHSGELAELRALVDASLSGEFDRIEQLLGLPHPCADVRAKIVGAVLFCLRVQLILPLERYSDIRKELLAVAKQAVAATKSLNALSSSLQKLPDWVLLCKHWMLAANADLDTLTELAARIGSLSSFAEQHAALLRGADKGGRPHKLAFRELVLALADVFKVATGKSATVWTSDAVGVYRGPLLDLVNVVLPVANGIAKAGGRRFEQPVSDNARGKYIADFLRKQGLIENGQGSPGGN